MNVTGSFGFQPCVIILWQPGDVLSPIILKLCSSLKLWLSSPGVGVVGLVAPPCCSSSFLILLSFARRFWNHTWITRISNPVSCDSCSRTCRDGFELWVYAVRRVSSCLAVIVVLGLFWFPSTEEETQYTQWCWNGQLLLDHSNRGWTYIQCLLGNKSSYPVE